MNFYELWNKLTEETTQYFVRYVTPNDFSSRGNIANFIKSHNNHQLTDVDHDWVKGHLLNIIKSHAREDRSDNIVVANKEDNNDIRGFALIMIAGKNISKKWLEVPIFLAENETVADLIVDAMFRRYLRENEFKKKAIYIRAHLEPMLLNALTKHGFGIESQGDMLLATYPKGNFEQHPNIFQRYDQHLSNQVHDIQLDEPTAQSDTYPKQGNDDDEFGLFGDLPWQGT